MATDKSEPRVKLIFTIGALAIVTLGVMHAALSTYFDFAVQGEELRKFGELKPTGLLSLRAQDKERLNTGAMPIDKAMDQLARQGRKNAGPNFAPVASKDLAALSGWVKMPLEVPTAMMAAAASDGGALSEPGAAPALGTSSDGGVSKSGDAGAPKKKP